MNLRGPIVDHIEIIVIEITSFLIRPNNKMILTFLEEPFRLFVVKKDSALFDFVQLDYVTG
jgi:hypothetical protein